MTRKSSFAPIADTRCRIVILGSLPGEASLRLGQYYGHPQNRFWDLVGAAIGTDLRNLGYNQRLLALQDNGIGLWDVIGEAERAGSLDSAIRNPRENPLQDFLATLPNLQAIAFNGKKSAAIGRRQLASISDSLQMIDLPSSSPAYAAMPIAEKLSRWAVIGSIAGNSWNRQK